MQLKKGFIYVPKNANKGKVKYMCIAAHPDDVEIMAYHGILRGYRSKKYSFVAVVSADGANSARKGPYKDYTNDMMKETRIKEQEAAGEAGHYNQVIMLNYSSDELKDKNNTDPVEDYYNIIKELKPKTIYTHSLLDRHQTHLAVAIKVLLALRKLNKEDRPKLVLGCEVWRDLDWVNDDMKVFLDVSGKPKLARRVLNVYKSQIIGGKRYDKAVMGRRKGHATFSSSHKVDKSKFMSYAINMTKLMKKPKIDIKEWTLNFIDEFYKTVSNQFDELM